MTRAARLPARQEGWERPAAEAVAAPDFPGDRDHGHALALDGRAEHRTDPTSELVHERSQEALRRHGEADLALAQDHLPLHTAGRYAATRPSRVSAAPEPARTSDTPAAMNQRDQAT